MDGFSTSTAGEGRARSSGIAAMLADPVVQAVMACDGVSEEEVACALESARAALALRRPGAPAADLSKLEPRRPRWRP